MGRGWRGSPGTYVLGEDTGVGLKGEVKSSCLQITCGTRFGIRSTPLGFTYSAQR